MANSEVEAITELAVSATAPVEADTSKVYLHNGTIINLQDFQPAPRRKRGRLTHYTADSLAEYVKAHQEPGTAAYSDEESFTITVVLNGPSKEAPGWSDHVATLKLRPTPEWMHWAAKDNKAMRQMDFAEHIQTGMKEIINPVAAEMLELAQEFQAATNVRFRAGRSLADGRRALEFVEDVSAAAGKTGQIAIPEQITLALQPFEGSPTYKLQAWFRFRITDGDLTLSYKIDRPRDVQKNAFLDVSNDFQKATLLPTIYAGSPS